MRKTLSNEKYIGNNVYNRRSFKLKKVRVVNQPEMWIKKEGIDKAEGLPSAAACMHRFGNLIRVYQTVGFTSACPFRVLMP